MSHTEQQDPTETLGEPYGAHGILQAVAAAAWLTAHADCQCVLATTGGTLGDRALASILYRSADAAPVQSGERRTCALARRQDVARWDVKSQEVFGHQLSLARPLLETARTGRPLALFIHGMGMGANGWFRLNDALQADLDTAFLGMPWDGSQGAAWGRAASPEAWIEAGLALLPAAPDVVVAHSFGANALLEYLTSPGAVHPRAVVLVSPFFKSGEAAVEWGVLSHHVNRFLDLLGEGLQVNESYAGLAPHVDAAVAMKVRERVGVYGWYEFLRLLLRTPFLDLKAITGPVLVLGGAGDIACDWADCERLAKTLPRASAKQSQAAGHFCMVQDADWFVGALREFTAKALGHCESSTKETRELRS